MQLNLTIPDTIDEQIADLDAQIVALQARREALQRCRRITCEHCRAQTPIGELTFEQTHWYERPHGCTGGDHWWPGDAFFACPQCERSNRIPRNPSPEAAKRYPHAGLDKLARYFGQRTDSYDK